MNEINELITNMVNEINKMPIMFRYPILLHMCQELLQELGKAEEEYMMEKREMTIKIMKLAKERGLDFLGEKDE